MILISIYFFNYDISKIIIDLENKENEHKKRCAKIDKFKDIYNRYEKGEMTNDCFYKSLIKDIGIKSNDELKNIVFSSNMDKKSFKDILAKTDILNKTKPNNHQLYLNTNNNNKYNCFYRNTDIINKYPIKVRDSKINEATKNLINNKISIEDYVRTLNNEGINTEVPTIQNIIKKQARGSLKSYSNLIRTINIHKNDSVYKYPKDLKIDKGMYLKETIDSDNSNYLFVLNNKNGGVP